MKKFGHPGFYKFVRRKLITEYGHKTYNKERLGYRGPKQRYSVWRAEYNKKWEAYEGVCCRETYENNEYFI